SGTTSATFLEHSSDGGHTWQVVGAIEPNGVIPEPHSLLTGVLASAPINPALLCAATRVQDVVPPGTIVPPAQPPSYDLLLGSLNAGADWSGASFLKNTIDYGPRDDLHMAITGSGDCYTADYADSAAGQGPGRITLWRLRPDVHAKPGSV